MRSRWPRRRYLCRLYGRRNPGLARPFRRWLPLTGNTGKERGVGVGHRSAERPLMIDRQPSQDSPSNQGRNGPSMASIQFGFGFVIASHPVESVACQSPGPAAVCCVLRCSRTPSWRGWRRWLLRTRASSLTFLSPDRMSSRILLRPKAEQGAWSTRTRSVRDSLGPFFRRAPP